MKIAIITFHRAINFGGVLQAYALQKTILKMGFDCDILDYYCPFIEELYRNKKRLSLLKMKRLISTILRNGNLKINNSGFALFTKRYLKLSTKTYNPQNIKEANELYDAFITGSDQVWSPTCAGFDKAYFLDFVNDKLKISYAASFGGAAIPSSLIEEYKKLIETFSFISVREESGVEIIDNLLHRKAQAVLDPTLLMEKEEWERSFVNNSKCIEKYVLIYMISEDKELIKAAKKYAKKNNFKILYINDRIYKTLGVKNLKKINPDMWVNLFFNAQCIFTNSFHGVAFAINFEKEFYVFKLKKNTRVNERIYNILNMFDISGRIINEFNDINKIDKINYRYIKKLLDKYRKDSLNFLRKSLENQ